VLHIPEYGAWMEGKKLQIQVSESLQHRQSEGFRSSYTHQTPTDHHPPVTHHHHHHHQRWGRDCRWSLKWRRIRSFKLIKVQLVGILFLEISLFRTWFLKTQFQNRQKGSAWRSEDDEDIWWNKGGRPGLGLWLQPTLILRHKTLIKKQQQQQRLTTVATWPSSTESRK